MIIELPYRANERLKLDIPEKNLAVVLEPAEKSRAGKPLTYESAGGQALTDFIQSPGSLIVIVNDATRPTPTADVLSLIAEPLNEAEADFIVATGAHRGPDDDELKYIFGPALDKIRGRIHIHDAKSDPVQIIGTTSRGTEVFFNSRVMSADKILIIGSVEPHYFAGFTGGRKGLLPGVAGFSTIEANHALALSADARSLKLEGNPVHEDMLEACGMISKDIFTIMTVLDCEQQIACVTSGELDSAFSEACVMAREIFCVPAEKKADLVIACAKYPMDIDLYQSQKAIENARLAVKPGGTIILVSACRDGIGDDAFYQLMKSSGSPEQVLSDIKDNYRLGYHKAGKLAELCSSVTLLAKTDLDDPVLSDIYIKPVSDLQAYIDDFLSESCGSIVIMPDASVTVPESDDR